VKRIAFTFAVLIAGLTSAPNARAQIAVIDGANLAQNIQTAAQAIVAVEQLKAQLTQLEQTYEMFTNPTDILNMATGMENQTLENPMPLANTLSGLVGGATAGSGAASTYFNQNHVYSPTDGSPESTQSNANAQAIANIEGIAATNLSAIEQRLQQWPHRHRIAIRPGTAGAGDKSSGARNGTGTIATATTAGAIRRGRNQPHNRITNGRCQ